MLRQLAGTFLLIACATGAFAQKERVSIRVSPNGVNVNANGATTVFLTFGGMRNHRPAEAAWCGELIPADPDVGLKCDPATIYGFLPDRFDLSKPSGRQALTDIMSIPATIARRAYQDARDGARSSFFYVRRFVSLSGGPDEYVAVTCRMAGGGVSAPFALTSVKVSFGNDQGVEGPSVLLIKPGEKLPPINAEIAYNGAGRLIGRWEVALPGDELPTERDLLTEATLPVEERGSQRRYTQLGRFNVFLPPVGRFTLPGPDSSRAPTKIEGAYQILLRIEVSDDQDSGSNLAAVGAGSGFIQSGAVAGFPLPALRYYVGGGSNRDATLSSLTPIALRLPREEAVVAADERLIFSWDESSRAAVYRLEIEDATGEAASAVLRRGATSYEAPPWLKAKAGSAILRWRVTAFDHTGARTGESAWRRLGGAPK